MKRVTNAILGYNQGTLAGWKEVNNFVSNLTNIRSRIKNFFTIDSSPAELERIHEKRILELSIREKLTEMRNHNIHNIWF